jgi:branched-chain amino acid transport system permease protein
MCVGLTLTYLTTKVPNFFYGSLVVIGMYTSFSLYWIQRLDAYTTGPFAFLMGGVSSVVIYLAVLRPLTRRGANLVSLMIATLAVDIMIQGMFGAYADYLTSRYGTSLGPQGFNPYIMYQLRDFAFLGINGLFYVAPVTLITFALLLYTLLTRTKFGVAMRAAIENPALAKILGINVERVYVVSWFLAGGLASLAGTYWVIGYGGTSDTSSGLIVSIFSGSVLGGLSSVYGAVGGGLLVGASENYLTTQLSQSLGSWVVNFQKGIPLAIMVVTLLILPRGIISLNWRRIFRRGARK